MVSLPIPKGSIITRIGGHNITTVHVAVLAAVGVIGFVVYNRNKKPMGPQMVKTAPDVQFSVTPANITPNVPSTIAGMFVDMMGMPVIVPAGYYYVFILDSSNNRRLVSQGSLGMNISKFSTVLNTAGWQAGRYTVTVTDIPLNPAELYTRPVLAAQPTIVGGQTPLPAPITGLPAPAYSPIPNTANTSMMSTAPY
jgi:hypothetical protein